MTGKLMKSVELRQKFFDYFVKNGHTRAESSSLIPADDPTLLFANAGMNQFKDLFLGKEKRSYKRAVTIQKCVRAGGKHNDLENVGFTARHLTFFEMMGNFSFGDYFKEDAIKFAWEFLTVEASLPIEKLHVSVFETDDEAYDIWHKEMGVPAERMHRLGAKENFWQMGDTGPCGPCTEIHIDRGPAYGCKDEKTCGPACDCDRFLEIWNLVFMQYNRQQDGTLQPLTQTGVDTGMGLERICAVAQNKDSVFEIDAFAPIMKRIEELTGHSYATATPAIKAAFNVLADHVRSSTMIIADGCLPSNEGRGYVLRKIIRRAALFSQKLTDKVIFPELSRTVIKTMGEIYPELIRQDKMISHALETEVHKFIVNLERGQNILERYFKDQAATKVISGDQAFKLYDTYGFPAELTALIARERDFTIDMNGFAHAMSRQQEQSGAKKSVPTVVTLPENSKTTFMGYDELVKETTIIALVHDGSVVDHVKAGEEVLIVPKESPLYVFGGGQSEDTGMVHCANHTTSVLGVENLNGATLIRIQAPCDLKIGTPVRLEVDAEVRANTMRNHTATHLLQAALRSVIGSSVKQSGSSVNQDALRFDFTHHEGLTSANIRAIETLVNNAIQKNIPLTIEHMTYQQALDRGVIAFFGEKYNPENVRMVQVPTVSAELCGGCHVTATGDIGVFKIVEVSALSAGNRRITAVTGQRAVELFQDSFETIKTIGQELKVKRDEIESALAKQREQFKEAQTEIKHLKNAYWSAMLPTWKQQITMVDSVPVLGLTLHKASHEELKDIVALAKKSISGLHMLVGTTDDLAIFVASVTPEYKNTVDLKNLASWLKETYGANGGGSPELIQGSGLKFDDKFFGALNTWLKTNVKK
jgi:alanyl-tRNA synthetase